MFTVLTLGAIWMWWQNKGLISKRTQVPGGLELSWIAPQCVWTMQPTLLSSTGPQRDANTAAALEEEGSALPCPLQQLCSARVGLCLRTRRSWIRADHSTCTHGWRELQTKRPQTAGSWAGSAQHHRPGWKAACVDITSVWERWWLRDSSSISCSLLSQGLAAVVWRRQSPAHQEITSDNSGKHVCYPFMRARNLGPNSGCAKRFYPEEICLLINTYWINWLPICSAVLLRLEPCCCYWKVSGMVTTQEVHQNTSVNLKN